MTDESTNGRRSATIVVALTVLIGAGMTVGFAGGSAVLAQQNETADAGDDAAETPTDEQGHHQKTVTAEGVEISEVRLENLRVSGLTVDLGRLRENGTEAAVEDALREAMGSNVEGLEVECVEFGNITSADITVEDDVATVDAQVESVTINGVSAERVTLGPGGDANGTADGPGTDSEVVGSMMEDASLDADRAVAEDVSIDRVVVEREGPQETPTDNETETPTDTVTETPADNETEPPADTPTETPMETPTETPTETPADNETETPTDNDTDNDSGVPVFEPPGNETDSETETPTDTVTDTPTDNETDDGAEPSASVRFEDQTSNGTVVTVDQVDTSDGGFVGIHDASLLEGDVFGSVVGATGYLEPGEHENVSAELYGVSGAVFNETELEEDQVLIAMPHQDTNDNETFDFVAVSGEADGPYTDENGDAVVDAANVTVEGEDTGNETVDGNGTVDGNESADENETNTSGALGLAR